MKSPQTSIAVILAVAVVAVLGAAGFLTPPTLDLDTGRVVHFDAARYPHLMCLAGRVVAETHPALTAAERARLWREYGLRPTFEWINEDSGFTYHELSVQPYAPLDRLRCLVTGAELPPRDLPGLVTALADDPRVNWAAPDALLLEWCDAIDLPPGEELVITRAHAVDGAAGKRGASLMAPPWTIFQGTPTEWALVEDTPDPLPDFEYYRECAPEGTIVNWTDELKENEAFIERCRVAYGTSQALSLAEYRHIGSPELNQVTVCVADTGVFMNHPELAHRLHPNAIDANYTSYFVAGTADRAGPTDELTDRHADNSIGLPREAVKHRPSRHGTCVAGILARCTDGFLDSKGDNAVRLLPASIKSDKTIAIIGFKIKTPISAAIKLISCLNANFPTGDFTPAPDDPLQNTGDVRVVSMSASVPKAYFSDAEWRIVSPLVGKAAGSIAEDLRDNDRVYLFASGNESQGSPNRPSDEDYVIAVAATSAYDGAAAWDVAGFEGANLGAKCVSAPGYGIITSTTYPHPNLAYLPDTEFRAPLGSWSTPPRDHTWVEQTNTFSATSSATPQVGALAALLIAQFPERNYLTVIQLVEMSCADRTTSAEWGESRGIVDYAAALNWDEYYGGE